MKVYLKVTNDRFRLPIAIADTAQQLAKLVGTSANVILSSISHGYGSFERVDIGDNPDE